MNIDYIFTIPKGKKALIYGNNLIIADVHLGYESEAEEEGAYLPKVQLRQALRDIKEIMGEYSYLKRVVIAGDLKHKFEALTWQERVEVEEFIKTIRKHGIEDIVLVRGNHDTFIKRLLANLDIKMVNGIYEMKDSIAVMHGHIFPGEKTISQYRYLIMGHEHPAIVIRLGGMATARFPVFLSMPLSCCETRVIVLPAFGVYQSGNPVSLNKNAYLSPIIRKFGIPERARLFISDSNMTMEMPEMRYIKEYIVA